MGEQERATLCAWSSNGIHVQGDKASIDAVDAAFHSHGQIDELKRNLRHWREECGKLHAWQRARLEQDDAVRAEHDALVKALEEIGKLECGPISAAAIRAREALAKVQP
jgi:hypothetical protein